MPENMSLDGIYPYCFFTSLIIFRLLQAFCRNGMKCTEEYCRCNSFQGHLIDPHSQKCVQVRTSEKEFSSQSSGGGGSSAYTTAVVFLCLISVVVAVLAIMMAAQGCQGMCDRGQYVCDEVKDPGNRSDRSGNGATPHVAAWDLPGTSAQALTELLTTIFSKDGLSNFLSNWIYFRLELFDKNP